MHDTLLCDPVVGQTAPPRPEFLPVKYVNGINPRDQALAAQAGAGFLPAEVFGIHIHLYHAETMAEIAGSITRGGRLKAGTGGVRERSGADGVHGGSWVGSGLTQRAQPRVRECDAAGRAQGWRVVRAAREKFRDGRFEFGHCQRFIQSIRKRHWKHSWETGFGTGAPGFER